MSHFRYLCHAFKRDTPNFKILPSIQYLQMCLYHPVVKWKFPYMLVLGTTPSDVPSQCANMNTFQCVSSVRRAKPCIFLTRWGARGGASAPRPRIHCANITGHFALAYPDTLGYVLACILHCVQYRVWGVPSHNVISHHCASIAT